MAVFFVVVFQNWPKKRPFWGENWPISKVAVFFRPFFGEKVAVLVEPLCPLESPDRSSHFLQSFKITEHLIFKLV